MRKSPTSVDVEAVFYVMEGVIYQAPTVKKLMKSRLDKVTYHLNNAFGEVNLKCLSARLLQTLSWYWVIEGVGFLSYQKTHVDPSHATTTIHLHLCQHSSSVQD